MINIEAHMKDGKIDWDSYAKAQIEAGEACKNCRTLILLSSGKPSLCRGCHELHNKRSEVQHSTHIRCPHCAHIWDAANSDDYELRGEGGHEVVCRECGEDFDITTTISYTFTSVELKKGVSLPCNG